MSVREVKYNQDTAVAIADCMRAAAGIIAHLASGIDIPSFGPSRRVLDEQAKCLLRNLNKLGVPVCWQPGGVEP